MTMGRQSPWSQYQSIFKTFQVKQASMSSTILLPLCEELGKHRNLIYWWLLLIYFYKIWPCWSFSFESSDPLLKLYVVYIFFFWKISMWVSYCRVPDVCVVYAGTRKMGSNRAFWTPAVRIYSSNRLAKRTKVIFMTRDHTNTHAVHIFFANRLHTALVRPCPNIKTNDSHAQPPS